MPSDNQKAADERSQETSGPRTVRLATGTAMRFIVLLGILSLLADATYEGARSINGLFLAGLGASGFVISVVSGFGELAGYSVRLLSGRFATTPARTWAATFSGYVVNLFAVPALALAGNWPAAAALMVVERVGKGVRVPPRDAMLSYATSQVGHGWGFGLHEAMDQTGAMIGPLVVALVLVLRHMEKTAYAMLLVPAAIALTVLVLARAQFPDPRQLEAAGTVVADGEGYPRVFWRYLVAVGLIGAGFADFPLIAAHLSPSHHALFTGSEVALLYALAMGVAGASSLLLGHLYDRVGLITVAGASLVAAAFAPLVFYGNAGTAVIGLVCWAVGMGSQGSIMRSVIAGLISPERRARAYGVFNTAFGLCWFAGSAVLGFLYDHSHLELVFFSVAIQVAALPVLVSVARMLRDRLHSQAAPTSP